MTTLWITGARGFIGRSVALAAAARGMTVGGIGHGAWPADEAGQWGVRHWLNAEVEGDGLGLLAAETGPPAAVLHLAGGSAVAPSFRQPAEDYRRTVDSTARLLEWLRTASPASRLVCVSSAAVYGAGHRAPIPEDAPLAPVSPYGAHKAMMELLCGSYARSFGLSVVVVRLFSVFGPGLRKQLLWDLLGRLERGEDPVVLGGTGEEIRDFIHVADAAELLLDAVALATPACPAHNAGTGLGTPVGVMAAQAAASWGAARPPAFSGVVRPGDPPVLVAGPGPLVRPFPRSLAQGVTDVVEWFRRRERT